MNNGVGEMYEGQCVETVEWAGSVCLVVFSVSAVNGLLCDDAWG